MSERTRRQAMKEWRGEKLDVAFVVRCGAAYNLVKHTTNEVARGTSKLNALRRIVCNAWCWRANRGSKGVVIPMVSLRV